MKKTDINQLKLIIQQEEMNLFYQKRELDCLKRNISYLDIIKIYKSINTIEPLKSIDVQFTNWLKDPNKFFQAKQEVLQNLQAAQAAQASFRSQQMQQNQLTDMQSAKKYESKLDGKYDQSEMMKKQQQLPSFQPTKQQRNQMQQMQMNQQLSHSQRHSTTNPNPNQLAIPLNNTIPNKMMGNPNVHQHQIQSENKSFSPFTSMQQNPQVQQNQINQSTTPRRKSNEHQMQIKEEKKEENDTKKPRMPKEETPNQNNCMQYETVLGVLKNSNEIFKYVYIGTPKEEYSVRVEESVFLNYVLEDLGFEQDNRNKVKQILKMSMKAYFETLKVGGKIFYVLGTSENQNGTIKYCRLTKESKGLKEAKESKETKENGETKMEENELDDSLTYSEDNVF